ncbi:hypothetical protein FACS189430_01320 [Bacteroidia bacterium]|nr:hypothetical protein FACS189430_01320 [Bacteroidia bacterium]
MEDSWSIGKVYQTVVIGEQTWMAENLRNDRDKSELFNVTDIQTHLNNACPTGWHIPTQAEFDKLIAEVGGQNIAPVVLRVKMICTVLVQILPDLALSPSKQLIRP